MVTIIKLWLRSEDLLTETRGASFVDLVSTKTLTPFLIVMVAGLFFKLSFFSKPRHPGI